VGFRIIRVIDFLLYIRFVWIAIVRWQIIGREMDEWWNMIEWERLIDLLDEYR